MPRLLEAMKDVLSCDKLRGGAQDLRSEDFRMGQPSRLKIYYSINIEGEPAELKHLSKQRKRKQK